MVREILNAADSPLPRTKCEPVALGEEVSSLIHDLWDTVRAPHGSLTCLGLAANQIGVLQRVIVVNSPDGYGEVTLVNPEIIKTAGSAYALEMRFSLPGVQVRIKRATTVKVKASGYDRILKFTGMAARIVQHELDHLDGILITDRVDKKNS